MWAQYICVDLIKIVSIQSQITDKLTCEHNKYVLIWKQFVSIQLQLTYKQTYEHNTYVLF